MMFLHSFFIEVQWTVIPNVKWKKFINMNEKMIIIDFLFLNPPPVLSILRFLEKWSYDISRDLLTQYLYFEMLTTISSYTKEGKDSLKSFTPSFIRSAITSPAYSEHLLQVEWLRKAT